MERLDKPEGQFLHGWRTDNLVTIDGLMNLPELHRASNVSGDKTFCDISKEYCSYEPERVS